MPNSTTKTDHTLIAETLSDAVQRYREAYREEFEDNEEEHNEAEAEEYLDGVTAVVRALPETTAQRILAHAGFDDFNDLKTVPDDHSDEPAVSQETYVERGGGCCPQCGSQNYWGSHLEVEPGKAHQPCTCSDCGQTWHDTYVLTSYHLE